jgi:hypothetical protein
MGAKYKLVKICSVEEAEEKMEMGTSIASSHKYSNDNEGR